MAWSNSFKWAKESRSERTNGEETKNIEMERLEKRRCARRRLRAMGKMEFSNRRRLFEEGYVLDWCEIDYCSLDRISCDAEP